MLCLERQELTWDVSVVTECEKGQGMAERDLVRGHLRHLCLEYQFSGRLCNVQLVLCCHVCLRLAV